MAADKTLLTFGTLGAIVLGFIPPLITWCTEQEKFENNEKPIIKKLLNFHLTMMIAYVVSCFIPFIGGLLTLPIWIYSLVISIQAYNALTQGKDDFNAVVIDFIK